MQLEINCHDWGDGVFQIEEKLLYGGYRGFMLDSIYMNGGTLKDMGKLGLPMCGVVISDPVTMTPAHAMTAVLVGDDITKFESWNLIEPQLNTTNVVPGDFLNTHLPLNCERVGIYYNYLTINEHGQKVYNGVIVVQFKLVNGVPVLTYNVNDGTTPPNYMGNPHFNEIFHVIEKRDVAPPVLTVTSPVNDSTYTVEKPGLSYTITDDNFKSAWYSLDDGKTKIPVAKSGSVPLDLPNGDYTLKMQTEDHFRLTTGKTISFTINKLYIPEVTTVVVTDISASSATSGGNIMSDGGAAITDKGICWSTTATPTTSDNIISGGTGTGSFITHFSALAPGVKYYYRAYAKNSVGTGYGQILSFTTLTTDIGDNADEPVVIYPNPADDHLSVTLGQGNCDGCIVEIYDFSGTVIRSQSFNGGTILDVSLAGLHEGIYYIRVQSNNENYLRKIIVY